MIRFSNVSFSYRQDLPVFESLNLDLTRGLTLVLGLNGCGKSTLFKLAAGVEYPDSGKISIGGRDLWKEEIEARRSLAYLPEFPDLTPYATIKEIMDLVCRLRREPLAKGDEALEFFDLAAFSVRSIRELSLGQKRRATFAAALIGRPEYVLLDEPLEALDRRIQGDVLAWMRRLVREGAVVAVISHTIEPFIDLSAMAVGLKDGKARTHGLLPENREEKSALLERLARGDC
jgi:ABC-type multidrug transport system ATPase subunit